MTALSEQLEDYLESIERLSRESGEAHVQDIAKRLSVHKSTVTAALRSLAEKGLISYSAYRPAVLTKTGKMVADEVIQRHEALRSFLSDILLLDSETAQQNACKLEHAIDKKALEQLLKYVEFVQNCPRGGSKWIRGFEHYCRESRDSDKCENCITECLREYQAHKKQIDNNQQKQENESMHSLKDMKPGSGGKVKKITGSGNYRHRLLAMGLVPGTHIEVIKVAPLGDPVEIKAKGYNLSLR
ncbi:MAG: DtxR family transcriptional regulator, partial [Verrucomicrobiota bacterium]